MITVLGLRILKQFFIFGSVSIAIKNDWWAMPTTGWKN